MKLYQIRHSETLDLNAAEVLSDFSFPWLPDPAPSTEFRAVWNEQTIRFRFDVEDTDVVLREADPPSDSVLLSDRVELFFAADAELKEPYYAAEMAPNGRVYDYQARFYRDFDTSWSFPGLTFQGELTAGGYHVEGELSLAELTSLGLVKDQTLIAGAYRAEFSMQEGELVQNWISWVDPATETPDFHVPSSFGRFLLVR